MNIAILGGGFTGLTAAYYLQKKGHQVTVYEKEKALGGLASGFKNDKWDWFLDKTYHHIFACDTDIINFSKEVGFEKLHFYNPITASLYQDNNNSRIIPVDTPQDFLNFPLLSMPVKVRCACVLAFLKLSPFLNIYEKQTAKKFLTNSMGEVGWNVLWKELFQKKFGKYADSILTSFIWARIKKRTKSLGYADGGFQEFINHIEGKLLSIGVIIKEGKAIDKLLISKNKYKIICHPEFISGSDLKQIPKPVRNDYGLFDVVISTLPTPVFTEIGNDILPKDYLNQLEKLKYLHAVNLILETKEPILDKTYWLSICDPKIPFMVVVQHTNFIDRKYFGGKHIVYIARYVDNNDKLLKMTKEEIIKYYLPHLRLIQNTEYQILNTYLFKSPFAQPIFDSCFIKNKPDFITPIKNLYCANLDMTYPYDRGTNYAVRLGKQVSGLF